MEKIADAEVTATAEIFGEEFLSEVPATEMTGDIGYNTMSTCGKIQDDPDTIE